MSINPDWANLVSLALDVILEKLIEPIDRIWFASVCKNWYSIANLNHQYNHQFRGNILPMLMIPTENSFEKRSLYSLLANRVRRRCHRLITWANPFKDVAPIRLPRIDVYNSHPYYEFNVRKVTLALFEPLSADPISSPDDYVVAAIYTTRGCLAFIKAGQEFWTYIEDRNHYGFIDVTFYKGLVYAVTRWKKIVSFDLCYSNDPYGIEMNIPNVVLQGSYGEIYSPLTYLVKSLEGELWMVRRFVTTENELVKGTDNLDVFKLQLDDKGEKLMGLVKLESLGDNILFVGDNDSVSVSASYFSNYLQKDSIYYSDDYSDDEPVPYPEGPFDLGIYNVKDGKFGVHCPYKAYFKGKAPPIWVVPPFQWS
ncbi:hypothetical protein P8452_42648 [Trifolium repens]|nr:hypothetical protein P8452_42648 [Trifolium repens]